MKTLIPWLISIIHRLTGRISLNSNPMYPVWWANAGWMTDLAAYISPLGRSPIFLLSLPRSGSSWAAKMLTFDNQILYLREPFTRNPLQKPLLPTVLEIDTANPPQCYQVTARRAFAGVPAFPDTILKDPARWTLENRESQRILVKDVNPLACAWLTSHFQPIMIYLIRHPAAVALSYKERGWEEPKLTKTSFRVETLSALQLLHYHPTSFWEEMGIYQAVIQRMVLESLPSSQIIVIRYETLCENPLDAFQAIYRKLNLSWDENTQQEILAFSTTEDDYRVGQDGLYRQSQKMLDRWKYELSKAEIGIIKESYLARNPVYYPAKEW